MSDKLSDGRSFRILTVVDQFTWECVCLEADRAMTGMKVAQALELQNSVPLSTVMLAGKRPRPAFTREESKFEVIIGARR